MFMIKILLTAALLLFCSSGFGETEEKMYPQKTFKHHVYIHPVGLLFGNYGLGYEMLLQQKHGIVLEGTFVNSKNMEGYGGTIQYRRHREGKMAGGFWGLFARFGDFSEGIMELPQGEDDDLEEFKYEATTLTLGANFGKIWVWDRGVSLHYRVGYGFPIVSFDWLGEEPEDHEKLGRFIFYFAAGLDLGLSFGYSF
jgi:hypothetical protein